jgi:predicted nucleic acid-binding protein
MDGASRTHALIDTSVLLNFLAVDLASLLGAHPAYRFVVTDHVRGEITDRKPEHLRRFESAIAQDIFELVSVAGLDELAVFARLISAGRLDVGESAAAARAICHKLPLATDDRRAKKIIAQYHPGLVIIDTPRIMRDLISGNVITIAYANEIKNEWETRHRYRMMFEKF